MGHFLKPEHLARLPATAVVAVGLFLAAVHVGEIAAKEPPTLMGLTFPAQVADAKIGGTHNFEKKKPGLGHGVEYLRPGWKINVYIYDLRKPSIPDDPESGVVKTQLKQAMNDIFEAGRRGTYDNVELKREYAIADSERRTKLLCSAFLYVHKTAGDVDSFLCVTSWQGKFIKFRMTTRRSDAAQDAAKKFLDAWIGILWPAG